MITLILANRHNMAWQCTLRPVIFLHYWIPDPPFKSWTFLVQILEMSISSDFYRDVLSKNSHKFQIILSSSKNVCSFAVKSFTIVAITLPWIIANFRHFLSPSSWAPLLELSKIKFKMVICQLLMVKNHSRHSETLNQIRK